MSENAGTPESRIYHPPELIKGCWYHLVETVGLDEDKRVKHYGPFAAAPRLFNDRRASTTCIGHRALCAIPRCATQNETRNTP